MAISRVRLNNWAYWTAYPPRPPTPITTVVEPGTILDSAILTAWYEVLPASVSGAA